LTESLELAVLFVLLQQLRILDWLVFQVALITARCLKDFLLLQLELLLEQGVLKVKYANFLAESEFVPLNIVDIHRYGTQFAILNRYRLKLGKLLRSVIVSTHAGRIVTRRCR